MSVIVTSAAKAASYNERNGGEHPRDLASAEAVFQMARMAVLILRKEASMSTRRVLALAAMIAVMLAAGCQSSSAPASASAVPGKAVIATTGNGTTTIFLPADGGVKTLSTTGDPACAQCQADAAAYFQTGTLSAKCPQCGATRTAALGHQ